jgi:hypothetical protein
MWNGKPGGFSMIRTLAPSGRARVLPWDWGARKKQKSNLGFIWCTHSGLIVYDLRRSAMLSLVRAGVPEKTATAISGHKNVVCF